MRALVEDLRTKVTDVAQGGGEVARARHTARGKLLPRDRVSQLLDPGTPFPRDRATRRPRDVRWRCARGGPHRRHRLCAGRAMHGRRQRRDREGRHLLPDDRQEAPAGAGNRRTEPLALHLPRRLGRGISARSRTTCFPTAIISVASSSIRRTCRPRASRRWRW